jgi:hypothetical protein
MANTVITQAEIDAINIAHNDVENARGTLLYAIEAGKLLDKAFKAIKEQGGDWNKWLKEYCPRIPVSTDRLYRSFWTRREELGDANALAVLGIREARQKLENDKTRQVREQREAKAKAEREAQRQANQTAIPVTTRWTVEYRQMARSV